MLFNVFKQLKKASLCDISPVPLSLNLSSSWYGGDKLSSMSVTHSPQVVSVNVEIIEMKIFNLNLLLLTHWVWPS